MAPNKTLRFFLLKLRAVKFLLCVRFFSFCLLTSDTVAATYLYWRISWEFQEGSREMENRNVAMKTFLLAVVPKHIKCWENYFSWNDFILQQNKMLTNLQKKLLYHENKTRGCNKIIKEFVTTWCGHGDN